MLGHGGDDIGASSINKKYYEKDMTIAMVKVIKKALENAWCKSLLNP
ncbi:N-acetylmuramoyl-L-alanine amidase [Enterococcus cecorum]